MSFQSYLENIEAKTGKNAGDFRELAAQKGWTENGQLKKGVKAGEVVQWLKGRFRPGPRARDGNLCTP